MFTWNGARATLTRVDSTTLIVHLPDGHAELGYAPGSEFYADHGDADISPFPWKRDAAWIERGN